MLMVLIEQDGLMGTTTSIYAHRRYTYLAVHLDLQSRPAFPQRKNLDAQTDLQAVAQHLHRSWAHA